MIVLPSVLASSFLAGSFVGLPSVRAESPQTVEVASAKIFELEAQLAELDRRLKPPEDEKGQLAERRLVDAEVAYELKNYEAASIILYDIIEKYPSSRVYPEALYFLSDSLYLKRDFFSSRRYFEKLVELGPSSGKYQEALQRLVELSLHTGDYSPVDGYLAKLAQLPAGEQLPSVPYVAGKYHYFRRHFDQAVTTLKALPVGHKYYAHGMYFIAAAYVAMGKEHLNDALGVFDTLLKMEPALKTEPAGKPAAGDKNPPPALTASQKIIMELAHLGRARILLEQGQLTAAIDEYAKIGSTSGSFGDALYESAWVSIKGKEYQRAARLLDLLLLHSPDSTLAPETRLLSGNLYIRQNQFGAAAKAFVQARDTYEPIAKQLKAELDKTGDANAYFRDLINKNMARFETAKVVPAPAVKWMKDEPDVRRLSDLLTDESELERSLADAQDTIRKLERALNGAGRVNVFPELARARTKGVEISNELTEVKKTLSEREKQLIDPIAGAEGARWKSLQDERAALEDQLKLLPTKADSIIERQKKAREAFNEIDKRASEVQVVILGVRAQTVATNKYYRDAIAPKLPPEQQQAAQQEIESYLTEIEAEQHDLDAIRKELDEAGQSVGADDADMKAAEAVKAKYSEVLGRQRALVQQMISRLGPSERSRVEQIESMLDRSRGVEDKLLAYNGKIDGLVEEKLGPIRATIDEEKAKIVAYNGQLSGYTGESAEVGGGVLADGLRGVSQRFYNVVIRSDVGIIDVAWALKDAASKESSRLVSERKRELKLLDDEFKEVLKEQPVKRASANLCALALGLAVTIAAPAEARRAGRYLAASGPGPGQPLNDKSELDGIQEEVKRFELATQEYRGTVSHIVQQEYVKKRKELLARYQGQLDQAEKDEKVRRESAILLFENFLAKYPSDERWTPDAMFRLAELYFEKANDEYLTATAAASANPSAGGNAPEIKPDYNRTIDLYKALIARFPEYRLIDGAYYLMGWCLNEMGKEGESLVAMQALICSNKHKPLDAPPTPQPSKGKGDKIADPYADCVPVKKDSRFLPEAWTRIGEYPLRQQRARPGDRGLRPGPPVQGFALLRQGALQARVGVLPRRSLSRRHQALRRAGRLLRQEEGGVRRRGLRPAHGGRAVPRHLLRREGLERRSSRRPRERARARAEVLPRARSRAARARDLRQARRHLLRRDGVLPRHRRLQVHARALALRSEQPQAPGSRGHGLRAPARLRERAQGARDAGEELSQGLRVVQEEPRQQGGDRHRRRARRVRAHPGRGQSPQGGAGSEEARGGQAARPTARSSRTSPRSTRWRPRPTRSTSSSIRTRRTPTSTRTPTPRRCTSRAGSATRPRPTRRCATRCSTTSTPRTPRSTPSRATRSTLEMRDHGRPLQGAAAAQASARSRCRSRRCPCRSSSRSCRPRTTPSSRSCRPRAGCRRWRTRRRSSTTAS